MAGTKENHRDLTQDEIEGKIDAVAKQMLRAAQLESDADKSLAIAALGRATMFLYSTMDSNQLAHNPLVSQGYLKDLHDEYQSFKTTVLAIARRNGRGYILQDINRNEDWGWHFESESTKTGPVEPAGTRYTNGDRKGGLR